MGSKFKAIVDRNSGFLRANGHVYAVVRKPHGDCEMLVEASSTWRMRLALAAKESSLARGVASVINPDVIVVAETFQGQPLTAEKINLQIDARARRLEAGLSPSKFGIALGYHTAKAAVINFGLLSVGIGGLLAASAFTAGTAPAAVILGGVGATIAGGGAFGSMVAKDKINGRLVHLRDPATRLLVSNDVSPRTDGLVSQDDLVRRAQKEGYTVSVVSKPAGGAPEIRELAPAPVLKPKMREMVVIPVAPTFDVKLQEIGRTYRRNQPDFSIFTAEAAEMEAEPVLPTPDEMNVESALAYLQQSLPDADIETLARLAIFNADPDVRVAMKIEKIPFTLSIDVADRHLKRNQDPMLEEAVDNLIRDLVERMDRQRAPSMRR